MTTTDILRASDTAAFAWTVFTKSAVAASHTGDTNETALATIAIPGNTIGANGQLKVTAFWSYPNSANSKTLRARLGGISGSVAFLLAASTSTVLKSETIIANRNSSASQYIMSESGRGTDSIVTLSVATPTTIDMTTAQNLVLSGQLASAGETITLEGYIIEYLA
jgi:hypothetical protein